MRIVTAGAGLVVIVLALFLVRPAPLADLDEKACDLLVHWAGPGHPSGQVAIVEIDEKSLEQTGRWPWPRVTIARLSRSILDAGAKAVALDMMFAQDNGDDDRAFAQIVAGRRVVTGYVFTFGGETIPSAQCQLAPLSLASGTPAGLADAPFFRASGVLCNAPAIAASTTGSGFLNAAPDHDGILRHVPAIVEYQRRAYPSLALAAVNGSGSAELSVGRAGLWRLRLGSGVVPLESKGVLRLRFRAAESPFPSISAADVLAGAQRLEALRGKIVIVGGSAPGMEGSLVTPAASVLPGVAVQATAIDNFLSGDSFARSDATRLWELALGLLAGWGSAFLLARVRFRWGALATLGVLAAVWFFCEFLAAHAGVLLSPLPASAAWICALPVVAALRYTQAKTHAAETQRELIGNLWHAQSVLEDNERRYRRLVENINDAIIVDDVDSRLLFANRRFREWFGIPEGGETGLALENYVAPEWRAELRDRHERRMQGGEVPEHFEFEGIRSDGSRIWIEALVTKVEEDGKIIGTQAALRDITARKRMEAQYLQAQKMETVGRLAGGIAHDFNNLLTVINGYSAMLVNRIEFNDDLRRYAETIGKAGERAADLTQKLLSFSRKQKANPRPVNLNLIVADAKQMLERVIGEDVRLLTRLSPDLDSVVADPGQIHQILMNLVINARDAMPDGGDLSIETRNVPGGGLEPEVCLSVTDTGSGLSDDVKEHLFEPFFTTKDQGKGTGLGLTTVYGIVQQSGGRIEVASAWGNGASFQIYLPSHAAGMDEPAPAAVPRADGGPASETILLVEDQDGVREFIATVLLNSGYEVLSASNGPDAIALAERRTATIHLLLADIVLPMMDGRILAAKLIAIHPETKVLYMSGYSEERIGEGAEIGEHPLLQKPFTANGLIDSVKRLLGGELGRPAAR